MPELGDPDRIDDDVLRLVFIACHPIIPAQARLALTLRTVAGLTTEAIARALLMTVPTVQQRIVRAKRSLAEAHVPFEVPDRTERPARLASVLQVIYLLFTEGYSAAGGDRPVRPEVAREAVRLARQLSALMPSEPEVQALIALMEFQSSRFAARVDREGLPLTLGEQDRRRWDRSAIGRGRAGSRTSGCRGRGLGYYGLQAAIAECHAVAPSFDETDWERIVLLYDALERLAPSAVVRLNRAVAVSMAGARERRSWRSMRSVPSLRSSGRCTRCAASCWKDSANRMPHPPLSSLRQTCPETRPRRSCCGAEPRHSSASPTPRRSR